MELLKISNSVFTVASQAALISMYQRWNDSVLKSPARWALSSEPDVVLISQLRTRGSDFPRAQVYVEVLSTSPSNVPRASS